MVTVFSLLLLTCGTPFWLDDLQPILICKNVNTMSIAIYCLPDYSLLFLLIINVSVPNSSTLCNPLCLIGFTALLGMISTISLNEMLFALYCPPAYFLLFFFIITVFVPNAFSSFSPMCLCGFFFFHMMFIVIQKK